MNISADNAIKHFFSSPSFKMIYIEAVANALDAQASVISIDIDLSSFSHPESLQITISDNGSGFNDTNYERFSKLMESADNQHKGLGRIIYLKYFESVEIESVYERKNKRFFIFKDNIENHKVEKNIFSDADNYSKLNFKNFIGSTLNSYDDIVPNKIKSILLETFSPLLYHYKEIGKNFKITISLNNVKDENPDKGFYNGSVYLDLNDLPAYNLKEFNITELDMFDKKWKLLYYVKTNALRDTFSTYLCIDRRAIPFKIAADPQLPVKTEAVFLLSSDYLNSKTDDSRQIINLSDNDKAIISNYYVDEVIEILDSTVPDIKQKNEEIKESIQNIYPHLLGFFKNKVVGIINKNRIISEAQEAFNREEKEILESQNLSDEQYNKSLDFASRTLAHYILYRNKIIQKLKHLVNNNKTEKSIHNLILPMKSIFSNADISNSFFNNNAWILDDKFMTYQYSLSDQKLDKLLDNLKLPNETCDNLRPDIALIFSDDIASSDHSIDVIIIELKRGGANYLECATVVEQIRQRARNLADLYPNKIRRIWFFGIIPFDDDMLLKMKEDEWQPLYSKGQSYYKEFKIANKNNPDTFIYLPVTLLSFDSICLDAEARNSTFLNVLKESIKKTC